MQLAAPHVAEPMAYYVLSLNTWERHTPIPDVGGACNMPLFATDPAPPPPPLPM
jgi:hypothetical protein